MKKQLAKEIFFRALKAGLKQIAFTPSTVTISKEFMYNYSIPMIVLLSPIAFIPSSETLQQSVILRYFRFLKFSDPAIAVRPRSSTSEHLDMFKEVIFLQYYESAMAFITSLLICFALWKSKTCRLVVIGAFKKNWHIASTE